MSYYGGKEITLADIPGLVEGAHKGVGLGDKILKTYRKMKILLHLIDLSDSNLLNSYKKIKLELSNYDKDLIKKKKLFFSSNSNKELVNWLKSQKTDVILISRGDPLWFGIGRILLENFSKDELSFYPSNTCIQLAFSKLKIPWQDTVNVSIHGRDSNRLVEALKTRPSSLAIITDSNNKSLEIIKKNLIRIKSY